MADLAKLANLSKRMKTSPKLDHGDESALSKPLGSGDSSTAVEDAPPPARMTPAPAATAPAYNGPAPAAGPVNFKLDLGPVQNALGDIAAQMREFNNTLKQMVSKGIKVSFGDDALELMDQGIKHLSGGAKAQRELAEKVVASSPDARWYGDLMEVLRTIGENAVAGGGGGGGGAAAAEITAIKEQLEMQKAQLTAILTLLQRRG